MLEKLTLGNILVDVVFLGAFIGGIEFLLIRFNKMFDKKLEPLTKKIDNLDETTCKNFLVRFLTDIENGVEQDPVVVEHAYEVYDHYSKPKDKGGLGCNSYIHDKWERLMTRRP